MRTGDFVLARAKTDETTTDQRAAVVSKAVLKAAQRLGLNNAQLADILGLSAATISRMKNETYQLPYGSKGYELALFVLRLFRSLAALLGGDTLAMQSWMKTENTVLRARPVEKIASITGLMETTGYVDSRRASL